MALASPAASTSPAAAVVKAAVGMIEEVTFTLQMTAKKWGIMPSMDMWTLRKYPFHRERPNIVSFGCMNFASRTRRIQAT